MPIEIDGPADATTAALAAALDAALAATATQHSGNSGADSKRKRRELGAAFELPGVPPAASPGAAPTAPPNAPPRKKNATGEHVLEALQASMGDLTERCAVLERERADLNVRHIGLSSEYVTEGCGRGASNPHLYEYANKNCRVKQGAGVGGPDELARRHGHETAAELAVAGGQWVLVEAFDEDEFGDEVWLGRTVPLQRFGGKCCRRCPRRQPCMATSRALRRTARATTPSPSSGTRGSRAVLTAGPLSLAMAWCASSTPRNSAGSWPWAV